jgi:hypothetical protein
MILTLRNFKKKNFKTKTDKQKKIILRLRNFIENVIEKKYLIGSFNEFNRRKF